MDRAEGELVGGGGGGVNWSFLRLTRSPKGGAWEMLWYQGWLEVCLRGKKEKEELGISRIIDHSHSCCALGGYERETLT